MRMIRRTQLKVVSHCALTVGDQVATLNWVNAGKYLIAVSSTSVFGNLFLKITAKSHEHVLLNSILGNEHEVIADIPVVLGFISQNNWAQILDRSLGCFLSEEGSGDGMETPWAKSRRIQVSPRNMFKI